jgi:hypothetical protein
MNRNFFCLEIQLRFIKTEIFLKIELEKFRFLRTEFFITDKIEFLGGKKESWWDGREIFSQYIDYKICLFEWAFCNIYM